MAVAARRSPLMTPDEYLAFEASSPTKHEYVAGEVFAMAGGTDFHNAIALAFAVQLHAQVRVGPCHAYIGDVKLRVEASNAFYYPDIFVTCDRPGAVSRLVKRRAKLIVEVLSDSTADYDRGAKFRSYRRLETLEEYVLIDSRVRRVDLYRRTADGTWFIDSVGPDGAVTLESVGMTITLDELYAKTDVPPEVEPAAACEHRANDDHGQS